MMPERRIARACVFCGSGLGNDEAYKAAALSLGTSLAQNDIQLVYGGGTKGLMGQVAKATLAAGGSVHGVMPDALRRYERKTDDEDMPEELLRPQPYEEGSSAKSQITIVQDMHTRKRKMADLSDCFLVLPGGYGTLEELAEMVTWTQLGLHEKPVILLNVKEFYTPLRQFVNSAVAANFIPKRNGSFMVAVEAPDGDWGKVAIAAAQSWTLSGDPYDLTWKAGPTQ